MTDPFPQQRIALATGVALDVVVAGDPAAPAIILLHGFPESHRTWRHQIPELAKTHFVIVPDQRGFARSDKPEGVEQYKADKTIGDMLALADHFGKDRFTLVGHDWGGAIAWAAALNHPDRIERLIILNAPHPLIFQRTLFDDPDQRAASQYITAFRDPSLEAYIERVGVEAYFGKTFVGHADPAVMAVEKPIFLDQWTQPGALTGMFNWYRASGLIVPALRDTALRPSQLVGLEPLVPDLTLVKIAEAGHFVTWEAPLEVNAAIRAFLP
ncbi:alpha/beta fold hydrolase [Sphingomonas sp. CCH10-B3]|uniref:alpha/beta fold hydrolase n=1 Tax=Sphingomonas sp. CCH10-B3 TaxID=1768757 RepID=UPI00082C80F3|nr:alpha/beta hydrolase [Sphingomonas sp. CCH10-B3]